MIYLHRRRYINTRTNIRLDSRTQISCIKQSPARTTGKMWHRIATLCGTARQNLAEKVDAACSQTQESTRLTHPPLCCSHKCYVLKLFSCDWTGLIVLRRFPVNIVARGQSWSVIQTQIMSEQQFLCNSVAGFWEWIFLVLRHTPNWHRIRWNIKISLSLPWGIWEKIKEFFGNFELC